MTTHPQRVRPPKPNQHERAQRQAAIDVLLTRALRGVLTIPEAAVLAEYVRAERRNADKTRRSLADTTRALTNHRAAADAEIRRLEERVAELSAEAPAEALSAPLAASEGASGDTEGRDAARPPQGHTGAAA